MMGLGLMGLDPSLPLRRQQGEPMIPGVSQPPLVSLPPLDLPFPLLIQSS
jgi:hypothetical protein